MSVFDIDLCRRCGNPIGHQEDYCSECAATIQRESADRRKND